MTATVRQILPVVASEQAIADRIPQCGLRPQPEEEKKFTTKNAKATKKIRGEASPMA